MILFRRFPRTDRLGRSRITELKLDKDMPKKSSNKAKSQRSRERALLQKVHLNAAGIDIGADAHWVAVPEDRDASPVRSFGGIYPRPDPPMRVAQEMPSRNDCHGIDRSLLDPPLSNAGAKRF